MTFKTLALSLILAVAMPATALFAEEPAPAAKDPVATQIEQRAHTYLDALKIQDLQTAYQMQSGALDKSLTAADFRQRISGSGAILTSYEITKVTVKDGKGTVQLNATYEYPQLHQPLSVPRTQNWILIDGAWYLQSASPKATSPLIQPGS